MKIKNYEELRKTAAKIADMEIQEQIAAARLRSIHEAIRDMRQDYYKELQKHNINWYEHLKNDLEDEKTRP